MKKTNNDDANFLHFPLNKMTSYSNSRVFDDCFNEYNFVDNDYPSPETFFSVSNKDDNYNYEKELENYLMFNNESNKAYCGERHQIHKIETPDLNESIVNKLNDSQMNVESLNNISLNECYYLHENSKKTNSKINSNNILVLNDENKSKKLNKKRKANKSQMSLHSDEVKQNLSNSDDAVSLTNDVEKIEVVPEEGYLQSKIESLEFLEKKRAQELKEKKYSKNDKTNQLYQLILKVKEEIKVEKNRLSAKKSREKVKIKLQGLEEMNNHLLKENSRLFEKSEKYEKLLIQLNCFLNRNMCVGCFSKYEKNPCFAQYNSMFKHYYGETSSHNTVDNCGECGDSHNNSRISRINNNNMNNNLTVLSNTSRENSFISLSDSRSNQNRSVIEISSSNSSGTISGLAKLAVFVGIIFIICLVGNSFNFKYKSIEDENISVVRGLTNLKDEKSNKRILHFNENSGNYYSNHDFSNDIDFKNYENLKKINHAISNSFDRIDKRKVLFETYKEIKNLNITSLNEKVYKEVLR